MLIPFRLYQERVAALDQEIAMVENGTHPEYLAQKDAVDQYRDNKLLLADQQHRYAMQSLDTTIKGTRATINSQYFQQIRRHREELLSYLGEMWYEIQRERRMTDVTIPGKIRLLASPAHVLTHV